MSQKHKIRSRAGVVWAMLCGIVLALAATTSGRAAETKVPRRLQGDRISGLAFSRQGDRIAAGCDGRIQIWEVATRRLVQTLVGHLGAVESLMFSHDGSLLASASKSESLIWNTADFSLRTKIEWPAKFPLVVFSPNGKMLVLGSKQVRDEDGQRRPPSDLWKSSHEMRVWDVAEGKMLDSPIPDALGSAAAFSPDGKTLAIGTATGGDHVEHERRGPHGMVRLYKLDTGKPPTLVTIVHSSVVDLTFTRDGKVVSGHAHGWVVARSSDSREPREKLKQFRKPSEAVVSLALAPGGGQVAFVTKDGLEVWDTRLEKLVRKIPDINGAVAFSPDGKRYAAGKGTEVLWWDSKR